MSIDSRLKLAILAMYHNISYKQLYSLLSVQVFVRDSYKQHVNLMIRKQYRMKPNVISMNRTARLRQCQTTNRIG